MAHMYVIAFGRGILVSRIWKTYVDDYSDPHTSSVSYFTHEIWSYWSDSVKWIRENTMPSPRESAGLCLKLGTCEQCRWPFGDIYYTFGCHGSDGRVEGYSGTRQGWGIYVQVQPFWTSLQARAYVHGMVRTYQAYRYRRIQCHRRPRSGRTCSYQYLRYP